MADLYNCPELKTAYCKSECPIGREIPLAVKAGSLEGVVLRFLKEFDPGRLNDIRTGLIEIAAYGRIDASEKPEFSVLLKMMDDMALILSETRLAGEKTMKE